MLLTVGLAAVALGSLALMGLSRLVARGCSWAGLRGKPEQAKAPAALPRPARREKTRGAGFEQLQMNACDAVALQLEDHGPEDRYVF